MKSNTQRRNLARLGAVLAAATLMVGATACSSDDDDPSDPVENEVENEVEGELPPPAGELPPKLDD
jgi:hypothetical protein